MPEPVRRNNPCNCTGLFGIQQQRCQGEFRRVQGIFDAATTPARAQQTIVLYTASGTAQWHWTSSAVVFEGGFQQSAWHDRGDVDLGREGQGHIDYSNAVRLGSSNVTAAREQRQYDDARLVLVPPNRPNRNGTRRGETVTVPWSVTARAIIDGSPADVSAGAQSQYDSSVNSIQATYCTDTSTPGNCDLPLSQRPARPSQCHQWVELSPATVGTPEFPATPAICGWRSTCSA